MSVVDDIVAGREQMKNAIFGPAFRLLPRKGGSMSVYLDDAEMGEFLAREDLTRCSNAELLIVADLYDRLGHAESSCGGWFMRYSILGFVAKRKERCAAGRDLEPAGDAVAFEDFLDRNPALKTGKCVIPAWQCKICRETWTEIPAPKDSICPACRGQERPKTTRLETPSVGAGMTHDEWITAGRPHWQCSVCKGIYVTVAPPDNLVCCLCITDGRKYLCSDCGSELLESGWCNHCSPKRIEIMKLETPKGAKFTAEELRKIEDAVKKEIDAYLNGLGWRMTKAQQVIDKALK